MEDGIRIFKTKIVRKTRRTHECWGCGNKHKKGSELINTTFSYDGRLVSVYRCIKCE